MADDVPAGWYGDGKGTLRWWDGSRWTQHSQDLPPAPPPAFATGEVRAPGVGVGETVAPSSPSSKPPKHPRTAVVSQGGTASPSRRASAAAGALAVAALVLALGSLIVCAVPGGGFYGASIGLVSLVLGATTVAKRTQRLVMAYTAIVVSGTVILIGITAGSQTLGNNSNSSFVAVATDDPVATTDPTDTGAAGPAIPAGFSDQGTGIATRWDSQNCGDTIVSCSQLDVYAYQDCNTVYVEANVLDADGSIVEMTNGTVDSMSAGDTAKVSMQYTSDSAEKVSLTKAECE